MIAYKSVILDDAKVEVPAVKVEKSPYVAAKRVVKKFVVVALVPKKLDVVAFSAKKLVDEE